MRHAITVRGLNEGERSWLKAEAREAGISMEEFVRRLIRRQRQRSGNRESVAELFLRHFGPEHGAELPALDRYGYRPLAFGDAEAPAEEEHGP